MKETKQKKETGIICKKDMDVSYPKKKNSRWLSYLLELMLIILISGSTIGSFANGCQININQQMYLIADVLLSVLFYVSFMQKKWKGIILVGEIVAYGAAGYYFQREISDGLAYVINTVFHEIEKYFDIDLVKYQVNSSDEILVTTIILIYISVFLIGFIAYMIRNELPALVLLLATIWIAFIPEMVGLVPSIGYRLCYFTGILIYWGSNLYKRKTTEKKFSAQKRIQGKVRIFQAISVGIWFGIFSLILGESTYKELTKDKSFKIAIQESIRRELNTLVRGTFCQGSVSGGINFGELGQVDSIEYTGDTKLKLKLKKKDFEPVYLRGYIGSYYQDNTWTGLQEEEEAKKQRLESASDIKVEDYKEAFLYYYLAWSKYDETIAQLHQNEEENLAYKGTEKAEWIRKLSSQFLSRVEIDNIAESYGTLFVPYYASGNILEKNGKLSVEGKKNQSYYGWDVVEAGKENINFVSNQKEPDLNNEMFQKFLKHTESVIEKVENYSGKKIEDLSIEELGEGALLKILNMDMAYTELEDYEEYNEAEVQNFENYTSVNEKFILELLKNFKIFRNYQQQYENYVYQTYLQVPDELNEKLQGTLSRAKEEWGFYKDVQNDWLVGLDIDMNDKEWGKMVSSLLLVKEYLAQNTSYTLTPGAVPEGEDFVTHFLYENKKGFCTHYATAATVMLRSLGIPARYVEGYMVGSTALKLGKYENDFLNVDLTDENAHAWVEIYIKDYGWVPVEMTPGYSEGFEIKEVTQKETVTTPKPTETTLKPQSTSSPEQKDKIKVTLPIIKKIKTILWNIFVLCLLLFGVWIRRFIIRRYRERKEMQQDFVQRITFFYKEIDRILCIKKHKNKEESLREWLQREREHTVEEITTEQWSLLLEVSNQCAFSNKMPSLEDVEKCGQLYHTLQENSYNSSPALKKIFYKYIMVM